MSDGYSRLYRSRRDRVISGVCGGLGAYLKVDPVVLRLLWLGTVILGGTGILAYLIAWILIPEAPADKDPGMVERKVDVPKIIGVLLIVLALVWLASRFGIHYMLYIPWGWIGPVALVVLGIALILRPMAQRAADNAEWASTAQPYATETAQTGEEQKAEGEEATGETEAPRHEEPPLRRSRHDRVLFGVCGGLAKKFRVDATLVRLVWALGTVFGAGILLVVYLVMALVVPEEEEAEV